VQVGVGHAGQDGDAQHERLGQALPGAELAQAAQRLGQPRGAVGAVHREHGGAEPRHLAGGAQHSVGDVVELEIEEHPCALGHQLADQVGPLGHEEL